MGKKAKEHRKKVAKRNRIIQQERKRYEKITKELFNQIRMSNEESSSPYDSTLVSAPLTGPLSLPNFDSNPTTIQSGPQI